MPDAYEKAGFCCKRQVAIDSGYAALVLGVCVIVGFATGLDPCVNLIDAATPCFFVNQLTGRVRGRLYS
jgi:aarF domain-containing kinase